MDRYCHSTIEFSFNFFNSFVSLQGKVQVKDEPEVEKDQAGDKTGDETNDEVQEPEPPGYDIYKNITEEQREAARKHNECFICQKRFGTFATFKRHIIRHTGLKNYKCHICGKGTTDRH